MAVRPTDEQRELARLRPFVQEIETVIRQRDPEATFSLEPAPDPGIWILRAFVAPPLDSDLDFLATITEREVDFQIEHGVSLATILLAREGSYVAFH
ncbi:MAG: hypothetical protein HY332_18220 [Chloroflexi bacterium]|nr:hypothetical protein [Chloroflexota bacterium]